MSKKITEQILQHPDKEEIISKLIMDVSLKDLEDWLKAKYNGQKELVITRKNLGVFKNQYLDIYSTIKEDLFRTKMSLSEESNDALEEIQDNAEYKKKLLDIVDKELDIKVIVKKLVVSIGYRAEQVFDQIQQDPRNIKMDKTLIEWMTLLLNTLEKFEVIHDGNPEQVTIQNNINVQMFDSHMNMVYGVIREILSQIDHESSLLFTELFTKRLAELKAPSTTVTPTEQRLKVAYEVESSVNERLNI